MTDRDDIYRREPRSLRHRRRPADSAEADEDPGVRKGGDDQEPAASTAKKARGRATKRSGPVPEHVRRRRRFRPSFRPGDVPDRIVKANFALHVSLITVTAVYFGCLLFSILRKQDAPSPPPPQAPEEAAAAAVKAGREEEATRLRERIRRWTDVGYRIEDVYHHPRGAGNRDIVRALEGQLEWAPEMTDLHLALAQLYSRDERFDDARRHLEEVLEREPSHAGAKELLVRALAAQELHEPALVIAEWVLKSDPFSKDAHRAAAEAYLSTDRPRMALPHLRKLLTLTGEDEVGENKLAGVYRRLGEYDRAIELLKEWMQRDSANSITYFNLAACYAEQGDAEAAVDVMRQAIKNFGVAYVRGWLANEEFGDIREATAFMALEQEFRGLAADRSDKGVVMAPDEAIQPDVLPVTAAN